MADTKPTDDGPAAPSEGTRVRIPGTAAANSEDIQPPPGIVRWRTAIAPIDVPAVRPTTAPAANDESFERETEVAVPVDDKSAELAKRCWSALCAPDDLPHKNRARLGLRLAFEAAGEQGFLPSHAIAKLNAAMSNDRTVEAPGATATALYRRIGAHRLYGLAVEVGAASEGGKQLDKEPLAVFGVWLVRRMLEQWMPGQPSIARLRAALVRPNGRTSHWWAAHGREKALSRALQRLREAITAQPVAAMRLGLAPEYAPADKVDHPFSRFNRSFRRRYHNLIDFATRNSVAGASGYGTLSMNGLRTHGMRLADRVRSDDAQAILICLQLISHLPGEAQLRMPVLLDDSAPPEGALAWIDLPRRALRYVLFLLVEGGARPEAGTEALYETTVQFVTIALSPFLAESLERAAVGRSGGVVTVESLLGGVALHPRSGVDQQAGYRTTVRRIQESIPAHLLGRGLGRWPVALASNSQFLVSKGRRAYSVCSQQSITATVNAAYELLAWPVVPVATDDTLVGSFVTPRAAAITAMINGLADRAERSRSSTPSRMSLQDELNAIAAWLAALLALALALRDQVTYALVASELVAGGAVHIGHKTDGPPVPVADFLALAMQAWRRYCRKVASQLRALGDLDSTQLAERIEARLADKQSKAPVFTVELTGELHGVGAATWRNAVPRKRVLVKNFGRHFWPLRLMTLGVSQLATDTFMRHHLDDLREGSGTTRSRINVEQRLRRAINAVIDDLALRLPANLEDE